MATILDLSATKRQRTGTGAMGRLRKEGSIPAILYGRTHASTTLKVDGKTFNKIVEHSASDNILVTLKIDGEAKDQLALVQEVQHDHLRGGILHIDFHAISADEEIHADVPVDLVGIPLGIKQGGVLEYIHHTLEVRCLPKNLPDKLPVDVTHLNLNDSIHVRDIPLPEGKLRLAVRGWLEAPEKMLPAMDLAARLASGLRDANAAADRAIPAAQTDSR